MESRNKATSMDIQAVSPMSTDTPFRVCLQGNNQTAVGTIIVDKGKVSFEGDADESALIFIEYLVRRTSQQWAELEKRARHYDEFMNVIEAARAALAAGTPVDLESLFNGELASAMFATMFAGEFVRHGAKNYLELSYDVPELGYFTVTTQRKGGKTPGDRIAELESRTVKLPDDEDGQAYGFGKWANGKLPATAGTMTIAYCEDAWRAAFEVFSSAAGIKVEAE
ncbi:hypothetical protein REM96_28845 (plasmid) [Klebsiella pneumoniae]|uniref:hypothetical protein n=1 Tax=Klebsiella pneumoniae TaxID=573 RepID=UPI0029371CC9|nr:hypothetical protein [Klebsiella pneumoniae]WOE27245.1 hypothetical protein REM96_28845 [Klebsiella pneumoniae]